MNAERKLIPFVTEMIIDAASTRSVSPIERRLVSPARGTCAEP